MNKRKTVEDRAAAYTRKLHGKKAFALRTTGTPGLSGWFQSYVKCAGSGTWNATSIGRPFHQS